MTDISAKQNQTYDESDDIDIHDTNAILSHIIKNKNMAQSHITGFNSLYHSDLSDIFGRMVPSRTISINDKATDISTITIEPRYCNASVGAPVRIDRETGKKIIMFPGYAENNNKFYVAPISADFTITVTATSFNGTKKTRSESLKSVEVTSTPVIKRSDICPLSKTTPEQELMMGCDPMDIGGYIILTDGWLVNHQEGLAYDFLRVYNNDHDGEMTRAEMLSKEGNKNGNSASLIIKLKKNGEITFVINHRPFKKIEIPFFMLLRLLNMTNHKKMIDEIVLEEYDSPISKSILRILKRAFVTKYNKINVISRYHNLDLVRQYLVDQIYISTKTPNNMSDADKKLWYNNIYIDLDKYLLPHLGKNPNTRYSKAEFLCMCIRYMILVNIGVYRETDRDSEITKRNESSGIRMIKMLKTYINSTMMTPLTRAYENAFSNMNFDEVDLLSIYKTTLDKKKLRDLQIQTIRAGAKAVIRTGPKGSSGAIINRLKTQAVPKNYLNTIAGLNQIVANPTTAASKQSGREHEMRRVQSSSIGYKCPVQTQESENIGLNKQIAISAKITTRSSFALLKNMLDSERGKLIIKSPEKRRIHLDRLTIVTINCFKYIIGYTAHPMELWEKFAELRRNGKICRTVTIHWSIHNSMISFYCDDGRMDRPLIRVFNNLSSIGSDHTKFKQWSAIRKRHINDIRSGKATLDDFIKKGLIDIITQPEAHELLISESPENLVHQKNNRMLVYTHVEMPAAIYGLPALVGTNTNLNPGTRATFATSHCRQAAGIIGYNITNKKLKNVGTQLCNQTPPVRTLANDLIPAAGNIVHIGIMTRRFNQEDSIEAGLSYTKSGRGTIEALDIISSYTKTEEEFKVPSIGLTDKIMNVNYSTINSSTCMPDVGLILHKNDVVIAKVRRIVENKKTGTVRYEDKSIIYKSEEPGFVHKAITYRDDNDVLIKEVRISKTRYPRVGDKLAGRSGQKGVIGAITRPIDMPLDKDGRRLDLILNPHSMPTRMTLSQMTEAKLNTIYGMKCMFVDSTIHTPIDVSNIPKLLESMGLSANGTVQLYDPCTGIRTRTPIFVGHIMYQNVQKNINDKRQAVGQSGRTTQITHQPASGRKGGLRLGGMERDCMGAIGITNMLSEKLIDASNPYTIYVCESCGGKPIVNKKKGILSCPNCGHGSQTYAVKTTRASAVLMQEVESIGIAVKIKLKH